MPKQQFTSSVKTLIYTSISKGNYLKTAAAQAGVNYRTVLGWMRLGKDNPDSPHGEFVNQVKLCEAQWEAETVDMINQNGGEKLKLEMLSRRQPENWAQTSRTIKIVNDKIEEFMDFLVSQLSDDPKTLEKVLEVSQKFQEEQDLED